MKTKKLLLPIFVFLMLLTFVSCNLVQNGNYYTLDVEYNSEFGSVTYTEAEKDNLYLEKTNILIEVTPKDGYYLSSFSVNGEEKTVNNHQYEFVIEENTEVRVTFSEQNKYYTVKVEGELLEHCTYTLTEATDAGYLAGSSVEIEVKPNEGYEATSIKVNGRVELLIKNKYTFQITDNTVIEVVLTEVDPTLSEEALASLQGDVKFSGEYNLVYTIHSDITVNHTLETIFNVDQVYQLETDKLTNEVLYETKVVNLDGVCALPYHTIKNEVKFYKTEENFGDYDNPFQDLTPADFHWVEGNKYSLDVMMDEVASCLSGWNEIIDTFYVYVEDEKIVKVEFTTILMEPEFDDDSYISTYVFEVSEHGTAETGIIITPYERVPEHDALEHALSSITNNYTIHHLDEWEGEEDISYYVYVDERSIFSDYAWGSSDPYGYVELNSYVYAFTYDGETVTIGDALANFETIADVQAIFNAFDVAVMEYVGNETYVAYDADLASAIATYIGEDYDAQQLGTYATSLTIVLKDGVLYSISYDYEVYGERGKVTLTYSYINETIVPVDFSNCEQVSVLDQYIGTYKGTSEDGTEHVVEVTSEGILIDGEEYVISGYDVEEGFSGTVGEVEVFISQWYGPTELFVYVDGVEPNYYIVSREQEAQEVTIPEHFKGVWADEDHKVVVQSNVIFIDSKEYVLISYSEETGFIGKVDGNTWYMFLEVDEETQETLLYVSRDDLSEYFMLTLTDEPVGFEIPEAYVGTWVDEYDNLVTVVITFAGIKVNGEDYIITDYDDFYGFTGTLGVETEYFIGFYYTEDKIQVGTMEESYVLTKQSGPVGPTVEIQEEHVGTYKGETEDGTEYVVVISTDSITINGVEYEITTYEDYSSSYIGMLNGVEYYVMYSEGSVYLMDEFDTLFVECVKEEQPSVEVADEYVGTFKGEKDEVTYILVATKEKIMVNETEYVITSYDEVWGYTGTYNGQEYYLYFQGDLLYWVSGDYSINVGLTKEEVELPSVEVADEYVGTFKGEKDEVTYILVATKEKIMVNETEYVITSYDEVWGYTGTYNSQEYYLYFQGDLLYWVSGDYSINVGLTKEEVELPTIEIVDEYVGTYEGTKDEVTYTVVITKESITVNGVEFVPTAFDEMEGYTGTMGGNIYTVVLYGAWGDEVDTIHIFSEDATFHLACPVVSEEIPNIEIVDAYLGTWVGTTEDSIEYTIVVTTEKITINGEDYVLTAYSDYEGYTGTAGGVEYYLSLTGESMYFMNSDYSVFLQVIKQ